MILGCLELTDCFLNVLRLTLNDYLLPASEGSNNTVGDRAVDFKYMTFVDLSLLLLILCIVY